MSFTPSLQIRVDDDRSGGHRRFHPLWVRVRRPDHGAEKWPAPFGTGIPVGAWNNGCRDRGRGHRLSQGVLPVPDAAGAAVLANVHLPIRTFIAGQP